jgi:hypothetical protein
MRFVNGRSGNPGGRPKADGEIRELARQHTAMALATLAYICEHGQNESARVAAANAILDRGWGKAVTPVQIAPGTPGSDVLAVVTGELPQIDAQLVRGEDGIYRVIDAGSPDGSTKIEE